MAFGWVKCRRCGKSFTKDNRHINENLKLGHKFFCSRSCQSLSRNKQVSIICENPSCYKQFYRQPSDISSRNFCSHFCAATIINTDRNRQNTTFSNCKNCGADVLRRDHRYCSLQCYQSFTRQYWETYKPKYAKEDIINTIQKFIKKNERIPFKKELNKIYQPARKYFGTWNNTIKTAGFEPNPVMFANHWIAKDGHKCDSLSEKIIDDYLTRRGIVHERNYPYPEGTYTADFKIGNKLIEFFGLAGEHEEYDRIRMIKKKIADKHKLGLIEIYPKDLFIRDRLKTILLHD